MGLIEGANKENALGEFSFGEAFAVGVSKKVSEMLLTPVIGNGNYWSGLIKLAGAYVIPKYVLKGTAGKIIATGLAVDGVEDVLTPLFASSSLFGSSQAQSQVI